MKVRRLTTRLALCVALLATTTSVRAASVTALDFDLRTKEINAFLAESSRLAATNDASRSVVVFARREEGDRPRLVAALTDWAVEARRAAREADFGPSLDMLGPIFGPADRAVTVIVHEGRPVLPDLIVRRGAAFDALYVAAQTDALTQLVESYADFIKNGDDETLRRLAIRDLPRARQLLAAIGRL